MQIDLRHARIVVTNDDGIDAPGIKILEEAVNALCDDVWVVAPESEQSAMAHALTIRRPLRAHTVSPRRIAVDGTPTDCALLAIRHILQEKPPTLVVSGVNRGGNLAEDVTYSGTVAATMEAALLGVPAIAFSQVYARTEEVKWETTAHHIQEVMTRIAGIGIEPGSYINVNFPNCQSDRVQGMQVVRQGKRTLNGLEILEGNDPRQRPFLWIGDYESDDALEEGTDLAAISQNHISITPLQTNFTDPQQLEHLKTAFE
ncbi:MAG: 5'/3'-nucleotidase SurE [Pseudomonadota bacterium]